MNNNKIKNVEIAKKPKITRKRIGPYFWKDTVPDTNGIFHNRKIVQGFSMGKEQ